MQRFRRRALRTTVLAVGLVFLGGCDPDPSKKPEMPAHPHASSIPVPMKGPVASERSVAPKQFEYILVYFNPKETNRLKIAGSKDGFRWTRLGPVRGPEMVGQWNILRDPSFIRSRDGVFHLVWTTGSDCFGYARSENLLDWTGARAIPINRGPLAGRNAFTWAPELFQDPKSREYLVVFSTATRRFGKGWAGDFQAYAVTTRDFREFSQPFRLMNNRERIYDIDSALVHYQGRYYCFSKFEDVDIDTPTRKSKDGIHYCSALSLDGPWSVFTKTRLPGNRPNSEGPSPVVMDDGSLMVYYDRVGALHAARTTDIESGLWTDVSDRIDGPEDYRHGTVRRIDWGDLPEESQSTF